MQRSSPRSWLWLVVPAPAVAALATKPTMSGSLAHQVPGLERITAATRAPWEIGLRTQRSIHGTAVRRCEGHSHTQPYVCADTDMCVHNRWRRLSAPNTGDTTATLRRRLRARCWLLLCPTLSTRVASGTHVVSWIRQQTQHRLPQPMALSTSGSRLAGRTPKSKSNNRPGCRRPPSPLVTVTGHVHVRDAASSSLCSLPSALFPGRAEQ